MITLIENSSYKLSAEVKGSIYYLHFNYKLDVFTKSIYKVLLESWILILDELKTQGVKEVRSIIPIEDFKTQKFQMMFGLDLIEDNSGYQVYRSFL